MAATAGSSQPGPATAAEQPPPCEPPTASAPPTPFEDAEAAEVVMELGTRQPPFGLRSDTYLFFMLFVTIFVAIANGSIFCFALFSPALGRAPFNFGARDINTVSTVGVITSYFSLPTGQLYDRTSPRVTLIVGTTINITGWALMYLVFSEVLPTGVGMVTFCFAISQLAATFFETGTVLPNLDAFALHEGRVVMIQKTYMGLGSSVIATWFAAFFMGHDIRWFFLFLCIFSGVAGGLGAFFVRRPQQYPELNVSGLNVGDATSPIARSYDAPFRIGIVVLVANMLFIFAENIVQSQTTLSSFAQFYLGLASIVLSIAFFGMLAPLPGRMPPLSADDVDEIVEDTKPAERVGLLLSNSQSPSSQRIVSSAAAIGSRPPQRLGAGQESQIGSGTTASVEAAALTAGVTVPIDGAPVSPAAQSPPRVKLPTSAVAAAAAAGAVASPLIPQPDGSAAGASSQQPESPATPHVVGVSTTLHQRKRSDVMTPLTHPSSGDLMSASWETVRRSRRSRMSRSETRMSVVTNPRLACKNVATLSENIWRPELWLMWYVSFATWGAMALVNSNTAQIFTAIAGPKNFEESRNAVYVSLFGLGSALGRVAVGVAKPYLEARMKAVWWFFPIAPVLMAVSLPLFLVLPSDGLFVPFFLVGFAGGEAWGATVLIIKRVFTEAGRHYSFLYTAGMLTPLFFNLWLFSSTYEERSRDQGQRSLADCDGVGCIGVPIGVCIAMNIVAIPVACLFTRRLESGRIFD